MFKVCPIAVYEAEIVLHLQSFTYWSNGQKMHDFDQTVNAFISLLKMIHSTLIYKLYLGDTAKETSPLPTVSAWWSSMEPTDHIIEQKSHPQITAEDASFALRVCGQKHCGSTAAGACSRGKHCVVNPPLSVTISWMKDDQRFPIGSLISEWQKQSQS